MAERYYRPKGNTGNPIFGPNDVVYMRFLDGEKIVRVARFIPEKEMVLALYPTDNPDEFSGEGVHSVDDNSPRRMIEKSTLKDKIWVDLTNGISPLEILKDYKPEMIGVFPGDSFKYSENRDSRRFHIIDVDEPESVTTACEFI